jgi:2-methylcitrate dehydratase PrpD
VITHEATRRLIERCGELATSSFAEEVDRRARHCILDHLACTIIGARLDYMRPSFAAMASLGDAPQAMTADGQRRPAVVAAYLNGGSANALDYDDTLLGHPGGPIVSAALAAGERSGATLGDLVAAVVVGYEAHWLLARAASPSDSRASKVRGDGVFDTIAAALAAAVATNASTERLERALGVAATHSCVPYVGKWYERPVPTVKNNAGWSAAGGVLALDLADAGAVGLPDVLDGPAGFWLIAGSDRWRWDDTMAETTEPAVLRTGFKRFPACWHLQQYLTELESLLRQAPEGSTVTRVHLEGPPGLQKFAETRINGPADVAFSIRTLSAMLAGGVEPGPAWVCPDAIASTSAMTANVVVSRARHRAVTATLDDDQILRARVLEGDFARPHQSGLTETEVRAKFLRLMTPVLGAGSAQALSSAVIDGESSLKLCDLTAVIGEPVAG